MRRIGLLLLALGSIASFPSAAEPPKRTPWTTGKITGSPEPPPPFKAVDAFPNARFKNPLLMARMPGNGRMYVGEQSGKIFALPETKDGKPALLVDLPKELRNIKALKDAEVFENLYGMAFHPDFAKNRTCFLCYTLKGKGSNLTDGTRVARFKFAEGNAKLDMESEEIVLAFLQGGHNGGDLHFGPKDGCLYISTGDAASPNPPDPLKTGQDCSDLLSSVLRIDVNAKDAGKNYAVPKDNPFVNATHDGKPVRPEIWSYGFRNPWRMSFDRKTGDLWLGDVGWENWEMVHRLDKGSNHGWSVQEARQPINTHLKVGPTPVRAPAIELDHSQAASVTGGYVYRGKKFPELVGKYIFGDHMTKRIWAAEFDGDRLLSLKDIVPATVRIVAFGEDADGELFLLDHDTGIVHTLEKAVAAEYDPKKFPQTLSATGLYADTAKHKLAAGIVPIRINAPMWNDGGTAERFVAVPGDGVIVDHEGRKPLGGTIDWLPYQFHFPKDSVLGRTITLETKPKEFRRVETQILHYDGAYWQAYTYAWRDDGRDADLVPLDGSEKLLAVDDPRIPGGKREQNWNFASRTQCLTCHTPWAETTLAFNAAQLNRTDDGKNQLAQLCDSGLIVRKKADGKPNTAYDAKNTAALAKLTDPSDKEAKTADRARSYLHANCSHCHRNGGGGAVTFELTTGSDLKAVLDKPPTRGDFGLKEARLIAPGAPERSALYFRMAKFGKDRMPHIGADLVDHQGVDLMHEWIRTLGKPTPPDGIAFDDYAKRLATPLGAIRLALDAGCICNESSDILAAAQKLPPGHTRELFEGYFPPEKGERKLGPNPRAKAILALAGDAERGEAIFVAERSQCLVCHKHAEKGNEVGPDLAKLMGTRTKADHLESLLEPSRRVDAAFQSYSLKTTDGRAIVGVLVKKDAKEIVLKDALAKVVTVPSADVDGFAPARESLMPRGLLADFTAQQAADLLAFLESLRRPK